MNTPEDYKRLGVNPDTIEVWEDGRRSESGKGFWEWWYFDTVLDDSTKVVIQFFTKSSTGLRSNGDSPKIKFKITEPDGKSYSKELDYKPSEASWSKTQCDVVYGNDYFKGDLKDYRIHIDTVDGMGADISLHSLSKPYRPGSAYFSFGNDDEYFTWFCTVPKGEVNGKLTVNGQERTIHGFGYHDHQWGNTNFLKEWNNWVWARQSYDDYSVLTFDYVSAEKTGFTRIPIFFIQDKDGNMVFENHENVKCEILGEYTDPVSDKFYPTGMHYTYENHKMKVDYTLKMVDTIESYGKNNFPAAIKLVAKMMGMDKASYNRYSATGDLVIHEDGKEDIRRSGNLIYEFMYPGASFKGHM